jgi:hypothetical protein
MSLLFSLEEESEWIFAIRMRALASGWRVAIRRQLAANRKAAGDVVDVDDALRITVESALATICLSDGNSDHS